MGGVAEEKKGHFFGISKQRKREKNHTPPTGGAGLTPCGRVKGRNLSGSFAQKIVIFWRAAGEKIRFSHFSEKKSTFLARALLSQIEVFLRPIGRSPQIGRAAEIF